MGIEEHFLIKEQMQKNMDTKDKSIKENLRQEQFRLFYNSMIGDYSKERKPKAEGDDE